MRFQGPLYRCLNPVFAADPLSGEGARRYGGRFNPKGMAALYTSLSIVTAIREAHQVGNLQPLVLVSYIADVTPIFDATDPAALAGHGITDAALSAADWRDQMRVRGRSDSQDFAAGLAKQGFAGMLVRSHAKGAGPRDLNMVLWSWQRPGAMITLVDDEGRLGPIPP